METVIQKMKPKIDALLKTAKPRQSKWYLIPLLAFSERKS